MSEGFRMPATGEAWREQNENGSGPYGSTLFTIIGMSHDIASGKPMVVFTEYQPMNAAAQIYVCSLNDFMALVPHHMDKTRMVPRFCFDREAPEDPRSPYISPVFGYPSYKVEKWVSDESVSDRTGVN